MKGGIPDTLMKMAVDVTPVGKARLAAAIATRSGRVISFGVNQQKTDPFQARFGRNSHSVWLHAEIAALKNAIRRVGIDGLSHLDIWVVRAKRSAPRGKWIYGLARPCSGCLKAIEEFNLRRVFYSVEPDLIEEL